MVTKPITFAGNRLFLNVSTSAAGAVRVELQGADGQPLPGFRSSGVLKPAVRVGDVVTGQVLDEVKPARGGVAARERCHTRTLAGARYRALTKNPQITL